MEEKERKRFLANMRTFLRLCMEELKLEKLPKIIWITNDKLRQESPTFGRFNNEDETIQIDIRNRHPLDVMRTLAHELTHYKQFLLGQLDHRSGETGSHEENQAHATAGVIMRHYDRSYPASFDLSPID